MKKNSIFKIVIILCCIMIGTISSYGQTFAYKSHTNTSIASYNMPYRLFVPDGYDPAKTYPLVLFLHGAGERGTDNNAPLIGSQGAKLWAQATNQATYPCFVLAPQCPTNKQWANTNWSLGSYSITKIPMSTELKMVKDIIETLENQYSIDPSRLYITGLSMGGYGTWDFILRYPTMFKAAIPICGAGDPSKASLIGTMPLRVFHSSDDGVVPVSGSRDMVRAITALGPNNRTDFYTEYTDQGHSSWINAYNTPNLVEWLFTANPIKVGLTDITEESGTITAQGENQPDGLKDYAIDNNNATKWIDLANANPATRASWIQYHLSGSSFVVTKYTITSANDFPERDPKSWELLGSNNGSDWTTLDTKVDEVFSARLQKNSYTFTNTAAYTYYRLQINSVNNPATATGVQLAELEILGIPAVTSITLSPTILNLDKNDIKQLYATVSPSNATSTVTWSSSNESVATVSLTGLVTAKAAGNATITATAANNNKTATCSVSVYESGITKLEAENATLNGVWEVRDQQGYSGSGFVANFGNIGNSVQFSITGATAGDQSVTLRYATAVAASIHLYVNDVMIRQVVLPSTGCWGCWTDQEENVTLNAGNNTIKFKMDSGDGGYINFDYLSLRNTQTGIIETPNGESTISFFPYPSLRQPFTIKLPENATRLSIVDMTGKIIYQDKVTKNEYLINQSTFKSEGVYIINVMTLGNLINKKIFVIK